MVVNRTQLGLVAYVAAPDGSFVPIRLARNEGPRPTVLVAPVPAAARGGRLVAFRLEPPPKLEERGADSGAPAVGSVELGPPRVDGRPLTDYGDWLGTVGADRLHARRRPALPRHAHERGRHLPAPAPADGRPADPRGRLAVPGHAGRARPRPGRDRQRRAAPVPRRGGRAALPGHPAERRPPTSWSSTSPRSTARSTPRRPAPASRPSSGSNTDPSRRAPVEARLRKPPFTALAVSSRSQLEHSLRAEPIARAALAMLETAALTAIVLALLGLVLGASQRAPRRGRRAVRPRSPGRGTRKPPSPASAPRVAGRAGRRGRRRRHRASCSRCSSSASSS